MGQTTSTCPSPMAPNPWNSQSYSTFTRTNSRVTPPPRPTASISTRRSWWWRTPTSSATLTTRWVASLRWSQAKGTTCEALWRARNSSPTRESRMFFLLPTRTRSQRARRGTLKDTTMTMGSSQCKPSRTKTRCSFKRRAIASSTPLITIQTITLTIKRHSS